MKHDISQSEIDKLEIELMEFSKEWESRQSMRALKWRKFLFTGFAAILVIAFLFPQLWWLGIVLIAYSAGSLFIIIDEEAKTSSQIIEHKKQLKLARLLLKFNSTL